MFNPSQLLQESNTLDDSLQLLTVAEVAVALRYSRARMYALLKQYRVPRSGPMLNRISLRNLKMWLDDPHCFMAPAAITNRTPKKLEV